MPRIEFTGPRLGPVAKWDRPGSVHYLFGSVAQVSPTQAVVFINLHQYGLPVDDLEAGVDAVVFDRLDAIGAARAVTLVRNDFEKHPRNGRELVMVRGPIYGGFVPLGAKLPGGQPHPHAGTGFGRNTVIGYPADHSVSWPAGENDLHWKVELQQYRFDGIRFEATSTRMLFPDELLPGWTLPDGPINQAIPDGQDLLTGATGGRPGCTGGAGVVRWRRVDGEWRAIDFVPVTGEDASCEPTLVRAADGSLVMTVRGARPNSVRQGLIKPEQVKEGHFQIWRSADGNAWRRVMDISGLGNPVPVSINRTVSGTLFLASNPARRSLVDRNGTHISPGGLRSAVHLWPIDETAWSPRPAIVALDCESRFGPTPGGSPWLADHPNSALVRLADGRWHCLLCVRVAELDETVRGVTPTRYSGCWIDEVHDEETDPLREFVPPWLF